MLRPFSDIKDYALAAQDGEIGRVKELYFEDTGWVVRYVVVDTGGWLTGRTVLLSPRSLGAFAEDSRLVAVHLTKAQIEGSPSIETDKPVSRQFEQQWTEYYGFPGYWLPADVTGFGVAPIAVPMMPVPVRDSASDSGHKSSNDPHLRSTSEVTGSTIHVSDGDIGHLQDLLIDDHDWVIRYVIVSRNGGRHGKPVILSTEWIDEVSWSENKVCLAITRDAVLNAPEWNDAEPITREYEQELHDFYGRLGYWPMGPK